MKPLTLLAVLLPATLQLSCAAHAGDTPAPAAPAPAEQKIRYHLVIDSDDQHLDVSAHSKAALHKALVKQLGSEEQARKIEKQMAEADKARANAERQRVEVIRIQAQQQAREAIEQANAELRRVAITLHERDTHLAPRPPLPPGASDAEVIIDLILHSKLSDKDKAAISQALGKAH